MAFKREEVINKEKVVIAATNILHNTKHNFKNLKFRARMMMNGFYILEREIRGIYCSSPLLTGKEPDSGNSKIYAQDDYQTTAAHHQSAVHFIIHDSAAAGNRQ